MQKLAGHDKIKTQIVAFLFNTRADVLREELYRALCLHALRESGVPCAVERLVELVAAAIDPGIKATAGMQTLVLNAVTHLTEHGYLAMKDGIYSLLDTSEAALDEAKQEAELKKVLYDEIARIALSINSNIGNRQLNRLFEFYLFVCDAVAKERLLHVAKKGQLDFDFVDSESLHSLVEQAKTDFGIEKILDFDRFIDSCFVNPGELLSQYEYVLTQVNTILQLLTWDPSLEYIQETILKGKTLYLDSSILFALVQKADPLHGFIESLLKSTREDLGVTLKVHEITLEEYDSVIQYHTSQFNYEKGNLRQLAAIIKKDGVAPREVLADAIFADYLAYSMDHIDEGSWQRFSQNVIGVDLVRKTLSVLGVAVDGQNTYVPTNDFITIKENIIRASIDHMKRSRRSTRKADAKHDAQMYYLLKNIRAKPAGSMSFGYDKYLLTLDGSLVIFAQYQGISWAETYFMYPHQWYELTSPFLRLKISCNPSLAKSVASMAFSSVFARLERLIPLNMFAYVFENGGGDLELRSVQSIIEALYEQRLIERLDPSNNDIAAREEAKLEVRRMVAARVIDKEGRVSQLEQKERNLKKEHDALKDDIDAKQQELKHLEQETLIKDAELTHMDTALQGKKHLADIYSSAEEIRKRVEEEKAHDLDQVVRFYENALAEAEQARQAEAEEKTKSMGLKAETEAKLQAVQDDLQRSRRESGEKKMPASGSFGDAKKWIGAAVMFVVMLISSTWLHQFEGELVIFAASMGLMLAGFAVYLTWRFWLALVLFNLGVLVTVGFMLVRYELEMAMWIIPLAVDILLFILDRLDRSRARA